MKKIIGVLILLLCGFSSNAQDKEKIEIYFDQGSSIIDRAYSVNDEMLDRLASKLTKFSTDSTITINKIEINSYASPEGGLELNGNLSLRRAENVCDYIENLGLNIPSNIIESKSNGVAWDELKKVVSDSETPCKEQVVRIIDEVPEETWAKIPTSRWLKLVDSRNKHLMDLNSGKTYRYMMENIFPSLRKASVVAIYFKKEQAPVVEPKEEVVVEEVKKVEPKPEPIVEEVSEPVIKPLFALKTNLLYDVVTALNVEVEVPIGQRWSVAGEWIFPWWTSCGKSSNNWQKDSKRNSFQLLQGNLEGKYWFGDRTNRPVMTGWNAGLYGGLGKYDLERKAEGYQGDFYVVGLSGGYAHTINKSGSLRMEYSLGVGYMQTDYNHYKEHYGTDDKWHTLRQKSGTQSWFGPTKAKVSLVWMLNRKSK